MENAVDKEQKTTDVAVKEEANVAMPSSLNYLDGASLNKAFANAKILAKSDLMPPTFKDKPENLLIAFDICNRGHFSLMQVIQSLSIIRGVPSFSGQFCIAAVKSCGRYRNVKFVWVGSPGTEDYGCYMQAVEVDTGETVKGTTVNWRMVNNYGWSKKPGNQWVINPENMFCYRAASYFVRVNCPELLLGYMTQDEVKDTYGYDEPKKQKTKVTLDDVYVENEAL